MPANASSPSLAERLIARLSPLRRSNLQRRILEHIEDAKTQEDTTRLERMLGRLAALS